MGIQVRYFAAAKAAMGVAEEMLDAVPDVAALLAHTTERVPASFRVLGRCSFLINGVATKNPETHIPDGALVDVLPPFAGG